MARKKFDDHTHFKHWKKEKDAWKKCAQEADTDLSVWLRECGNEKARLRGYLDA